MMPKPLPEDTVDSIMAMIGEGHTSNAIAAAHGICRQTVTTYRGMYNRGVTQRQAYDVSLELRYYENDETAETLAKLLNGKRFDDNVRTKTYGRPATSQPTHVITQSSVALCG